jgi:hypothetical protein
LRLRLVTGTDRPSNGGIGEERRASQTGAAAAANSQEDAMIEQNALLEQIVQELREVRRELAAIHDDVAPFAEERRTSRRMQSPLVGVDLFRGESEDRRD